MDRPPGHVDDHSPDVVHSVDPQERISQAILAAFQKCSVEPLEREVRLQDKLDVDALNALDWDHGSSVRLGFSLWNHRVVVRPEAVRLYELS